MLIYALTIFLSAFLIFQIQPLMAKFILPWFGGSPAVWTTSLLFFQTFLLAGYVYAHLIVRRLKPRYQVILHSLVLLLGLASLPIIPSSAWQPASGLAPAVQILLLLTVNLGIPYFILSTSAPLIQAWFNRSYPQASPYRLYALSNIGSLLGLLTYPFLFEPLLTRNVQALSWSVGFVAYVLLCVLILITIWRRSAGIEAAAQPATEASDQPPPRRGMRIMWIALSATAVILLLSFTNQLTQDVAPIPFLWVVPLSIYLLTFIIAFDHDRWYLRSWVIGGLFIAVAAAVALITLSAGVSLPIQLVVYNLVLFFLCLFCHGELARMRPDPQYLTGYFLTIALGGAMGGLFVGLIAPAIFNDYYETFVGLAGIVLLIGAIVAKYDQAVIRRMRWRRIWIALGGLAIGCLVWGIGFQITQDRDTTLVKVRNFYGVLTVLESSPGQPDESRWLISGAVTHGIQFADDDRSGLPTTYYSETSGAGRLMRMPSDEPRKIGVIGLGVGTLATYGRPGDDIRMYDINPEVETIARTYFTYLDDSQADIDVIINDGRLALENEPPNQFDILVLDAFTGDSIPVHLLTEEAFAIYLSHIQPDGVIAVHISNLHIDLEPVMYNVVERYDLEGLLFVSEPDADRGGYLSYWFVMTRDSDLVASLSDQAVDRSEMPRSIRLWTDDYTSILPLLR